jgi:hypothetical protein
VTTGKAVVVALSTDIVHHFLEKVEDLLAESPILLIGRRLLRSKQHLEMSFRKVTKGRQAVDVRRGTNLPIVRTLRSRHQQMVFPNAITTCPDPKCFRIAITMIVKVGTADLVPEEISFRPVAMVDEAIKAPPTYCPIAAVIVLPSQASIR